MNHDAIITFIAGSVFIILSTLPRAAETGVSARLTRVAATLFILGSLMLW